LQDTKDLAHTTTKKGARSFGSEGHKPLMTYVTESGFIVKNGVRIGGATIVECIYAPIRATKESLDFLVSSHAFSQEVFLVHSQKTADVIKKFNEQAEAQFGKAALLDGIEDVQFVRSPEGIEDYIQISLDVAQEKVMDLWTLSCSLSARIMGQAAQQIAVEIVRVFGEQTSVELGLEFAGFLSQLLLNSFIMGLDIAAEANTGSVRKNAPGILVRPSLQDQLLATMTAGGEKQTGKLTQTDLKVFVEFFNQDNRQQEASERMLQQVRNSVEQLKDESFLKGVQKRAMDYLLAGMKLSREECEKKGWYDKVLASFVNPNPDTDLMKLFKKQIDQEHGTNI